MIKAVHAAVVMCKQLLHFSGVVLPQLSKRTLRFGKRAMQQHQHRRTGCANRWHALKPVAIALERHCKDLGRQLVQAGVHLTVHLLGNPDGSQARRRFAQQTGDHLNGRQQYLPQAPAGGAFWRASLLQAPPDQLRGHTDFLWQGIRTAGTTFAQLVCRRAPRQAGLRQHQIPCRFGVQHQ